MLGGSVRRYSNRVKTANGIPYRHHNIPVRRLCMTMQESMEPLSVLASKNVQQILSNCIKPNEKEKMLLLYDRKCPLSEILTEAYKEVRECSSIDVDRLPLEDMFQAIDGLAAGDLVVTIQTGALQNRLDTEGTRGGYRLRMELFQKGLKNVDHVHLGLLTPDQYYAYINALGFNPQIEGKKAYWIKEQLDKAHHIVVRCGQGTELVYNTGMEPALLNIGDYTGMKNIGGTFPVGEVFSEPQSLSCVNGEVMVFGFPNLKRLVDIPEKPFKVKIENGLLTEIAPDAPSTFTEVMDLIRAAEGQIMVREFGLGLNTAMGKDHPVNDVTAFERQQGLHLSLGRRHTVFKKPGISTKKSSKFHVDMFVDVEDIIVDGKLFFNKDKGYLME